ncbi:hypothetical protein M758_5G199200 [Ceratodon purpureus]|nr:hypothetical protein M758_5G199200 [Ceratodon purpureus]
MNLILGFSFIFSISVSSFRTCWRKCAAWFWFRRKVQLKEAFRSSWTAQENKRTTKIRAVGKYVDGDVYVLLCGHLKPFPGFKHSLAFLI